MHLARKRGALLAHVHTTNSQYTRPAIDTKSADQTNREGVAERCADPAVHKSIEVELARITYDDALRRDVERTSVKTAKHHDAQTLYLLQTVPGIGQSLSLVLLDAIHQIDRFPRVQDFASSCRVVKCAKESAGQRSGTAGTKIGNAHLTWAFSEAAGLCLRDKPAGHTCLASLENHQSKGKALTLFAHQLARAVYSMLQHQTAFDMSSFLQSSGSVCATASRPSSGQRSSAAPLGLYGRRGSSGDTLTRSGTRESGSTTGKAQSPSGFGPRHSAGRYATPEDRRIVRGGVGHASGLALLEGSPVRVLTAQ
jgi:transposase